MFKSKLRYVLPPPDVAHAILIALMVIGFALALMFPRTARADDDRDRKVRAALALAGPKGDDRDRAARVALAFSEHAAKPVVIHTAPPPKAKGPCPCGPGCKCGPGECPDCPAARKELDRLRDSLVRIRRDAGGGRSAHGSGTVIWAGEGKCVVLTAAHVVSAGAGKMEVRGNGKWHPASVLAKDDRADVAAVLVAAELPAVAVAETDPAPGDEVLMLGVTSLWSRSTLAGATVLDGASFYLLAGDADQFSDGGDSGGGVFVRGELVAIHCGKVGSPAVPYCAKSGAIRQVLARVLKRDGTKVALIEPAAAKAAAPKEPRIGAEYDAPFAAAGVVWVPVDYHDDRGRHVSRKWVPQRAPQPGTCPGGRCALPTK